MRIAAAGRWTWTVIGPLHMLLCQIWLTPRCGMPHEWWWIQETVAPNDLHRILLQSLDSELGVCQSHRPQLCLIATATWIDGGVGKSSHIFEKYRKLSWKLRYVQKSSLRRIRIVSTGGQSFEVCMAWTVMKRSFQRCVMIAASIWRLDRDWAYHELGPDSARTKVK